MKAFFFLKRLENINYYVMFANEFIAKKVLVFEVMKGQAQERQKKLKLSS